MYISNYHRIYLNSYIKMEHMHSIWCVGIETYEIRSVICSVDSETSYLYEYCQALSPNPLGPTQSQSNHEILVTAQGPIPFFRHGASNSANQLCVAAL